MEGADIAAGSQRPAELAPRPPTTGTAVVLRLSVHKSHPEALLTHRWQALRPRASVSAGLAEDLRICISPKFPGDAGVAGQGTHFEISDVDPRGVTF